MTQGQSYPTTFLRSDNSFQDPISNNLTTNNPAYPYSSIFSALFGALGTSFWQTLFQSFGSSFWASLYAFFGYFNIFPPASSEANICINEGILVAQEFGNTAQTGVTGGNSLWLADCQRIFCSATVTGIMTGQIDNTDAPPGFTQCFKLTVTGTQGSLAAGDIIDRFNSVEPARANGLRLGTANAVSSTIGWWVKPSISMTVSMFVASSNEDASYFQDFALTSGVWQFIQMVVPPTATGTGWSDACPAKIPVGLCLGSGSSFFGTPNQWNAGSAIHADNTVTNFLANAGAVFKDAGPFWFPNVVSIPASSTPFLVRPYEKALPLCQRYYYDFTSQAVSGVVQLTGQAFTANDGAFPFWFPVEMGVAPSFATSGTLANFKITNASLSGQVVTAVTLIGAGTRSAYMQFTTNTGGLVAGNAVNVFAAAVAGTKLKFRARSPA